jgi:hypothetical protein
MPGINKLFDIAMRSKAKYTLHEVAMFLHSRQIKKGKIVLNSLSTSP